jgi:putative Mn2+ efflux pump MntP
MKCPECGTRLHRRSFISLAVMTTLVIVAFCASLFLLPFELFFAFACLLLFGIRYIEKQFSMEQKREVRCPICGHVEHMAHNF